jgi:uncharacterized protein
LLELGKERVMSIEELLQTKRADILRLAGQYGAHNVRIFGSVARGEAGPESDIDFLVDFEPGRSLFDMSGLLLDLQDLLDRKVDLVDQAGLYWYLRDRILAEAVPL